MNCWPMSGGSVSLSVKRQEQTWMRLNRSPRRRGQSRSESGRRRHTREVCQAQNHQLRTAFQYGIAFETMNASRTNQRRTTMGKAAFNERFKLAATYWNNISAGLTLTGLIIPYLALNYWIVDLIAWVPDWLDGKAKLSD